MTFLENSVLGVDGMNVFSLHFAGPYIAYAAATESLNKVVFQYN
jgi:hypothetical protein